MLKIIVAAQAETANQLANMFAGSSDYSVINVCNRKERLEKAVLFSTTTPDLLFVVEGIEGNGRTTDILVRIKQANPMLRIIYCIGSDISNDYVLRSLISLVEAGICDIYHGNSLSQRVVSDLINNPKSKNDMNYLYTALSNNQARNKITDTSYEEPQEDMPVVKDNLFVFSSVKPGSGKSFVSVNTAAAIAMYGRPKHGGTAPRICLVEGDLQTLSIGTVLGISNPTFNLKEALRQASRVVTPEGAIYADGTTQGEVNNFLLSCCLSVPDIPNLYALTGSNMTLVDLNQINSFQYFYILDILCELFDVVLVDANSSLEHKTTGPLLQMAKEVFLIMSPDYISAAINQRFYRELKKIKVAEKTTYVINQYLTESQMKSLRVQPEYEQESVISPFHPEFKIPFVDPVIAYNHMYSHTPLMADKSFATIQSRLEIAKIANKIWTVDCFKEFESEIAEIRKKAK